MPRPSVSGFTFVRNAIRFDYPILPAIQSILPLCDEVIVNIGDSEDGTRELIARFARQEKRIKIIDSVWDPRFTAKSRILAMQTNIALYQCTGDWALYVQADECLHEDGIMPLKRALENHAEDPRVEGMLFDYIHFFGNYHYFADSYQWYRKEIRLIRNHMGITSWKDAQGFRVDGRKLNVVDSGARMFHYGWVRPPEKMAAKIDYHESLHHGVGKKKPVKQNPYSFMADPKTLRPFTGHHPAVIRDWLAKREHPFDPAQVRRQLTWKDRKRRLVNFIGKKTGWYPGEYRNYRPLKS